MLKKLTLAGALALAALLTPKAHAEDTCVTSCTLEIYNNEYTPAGGWIFQLVGSCQPYLLYTNSQKTVYTDLCILSPITQDCTNLSGATLQLVVYNSNVVLPTEPTQVGNLIITCVNMGPFATPIFLGAKQNECIYTFGKSCSIPLSVCYPFMCKTCQDGTGGQ